MTASAPERVRELVAELRRLHLRMVHEYDRTHSIDIAHARDLAALFRTHGPDLLTAAEAWANAQGRLAEICRVCEQIDPHADVEGGDDLTVPLAVELAEAQARIAELTGMGVLHDVESSKAPDLDTRYCPACGADWQGGPIPPQRRHHYGGRTHFRRAIFVNHLSERGRQGGNTLKCPDCRAEWPA